MNIKEIKLESGNEEERDQWSDASLILMNREVKEVEIGQDLKTEE